MITVLIGLMNSGKTLIMSYFLKKDYDSGRNIITNYDLFFPKSKFNNKIFKINKEMLEKWGREGKTLNNCSIGLDEIHIFMDSRLSMTNTVLSYFFTQSSKDDLNIYLTTQHNNQIDSRLRNNLHKIIQCSRCILSNGKYYSISDEKRFLPKQYIDKLYIKFTEFKRVNVGFLTTEKKVQTIYLKASDIFKYYNTRQKIVKE